MKRLILFYMLFLILWFGGVIAATYMVGPNATADLGLGVAGGVFVAEFRVVVDKVLSHETSKGKGP